MKSRLQLVKIELDVVEIERLAALNPDELRRLHHDIFGSDWRFGNAEQARRRIARRIQEEREGGLPASARQHALAIARDAGLRLRTRLGAKARGPLANASVRRIVSDHDSRVPMPGSIIVKEYRGRTLEVHVLDSGFEYDGRRFSSLSAIARAITGTKWNGWAFFGLTRAHGR